MLEVVKELSNVLKKYIYWFSFTEIGKIEKKKKTVLLIFLLLETLIKKYNVRAGAFGVTPGGGGFFDFNPGGGGFFDVTPGGGLRSIKNKNKDKDLKSLS